MLIALEQVTLINRVNQENTMNKKRIFISTGLVILALTATVGILIAIRPTKQQSSTSNQEIIKLSPDGTRDYSACSILNKDFIKSTLGEPAAQLQGPDLIGLSILPNNDQIQVCSYAFKTGGNSGNQFNSSNAFTTEVYVHKDQASKDNFILLHQADGDKVSNIGESAVFVKRTFSEGNTNFLLVVYKNLKHFTFSINQPVGVALFDEASAKSKLIEIAKSVKY